MNILVFLSVLTLLNSDSTNKHMPCRHDSTYGKYMSVEQMPVFPGGEAELIDNLKQLFVLSTNYSGIVYLSFTVNCNGFMCNFKVTQSKTDVNLNVQNEVMKIVPRFNMKWTPGLQNGIPVDVKYNIPLRFKDGRIVNKV